MRCPGSVIRENLSREHPIIQPCPPSSNYPYPSLGFGYTTLFGTVAEFADGSVRRYAGVSAPSNLAPREAFTPQLFASHLHNQSFEIRAGQVFADVRQAARQVFPDTLFSALTTLGIGVRPAQDTNPTRSCNYSCN